MSLYIPEAIAGEGVPITADPIGTDNTGHTTWRIAAGTPSGTFTDLKDLPTSVVGTFRAASPLSYFPTLSRIPRLQPRLLKARRTCTHSRTSAARRARARTVR